MTGQSMLDELMKLSPSELALEMYAVSGSSGCADRIEGFCTRPGTADLYLQGDVPDAPFIEVHI